MSGFAKGYVSPSVPVKNSSDNILERDAVGNKTDDEAGTSLTSKAFILETHVHGVAKVAPTLASGISVVAANGVGSWTLGAFSDDIIAAGAVADPYDIHFISIESINTSTTYCIVLYAGNADTEVGRCRFVRTSTGERVAHLPFMTPLIPGGSRLRAKLATPDDNGEAITMSVAYHTY